MGLDITFFKTKRPDFKNGEVGVFDENGDNKYGDKEIYYLRNNRELRDYLQSLDESNTWINQKVIELDYDIIKKLSKFVEDENFVNILSESLNKGYVVYVECNW
jgi:hypothetical protein